MMIQPCQSNDDLLADIHAVRHEPGALHLWWLGQSGYLIQWQGEHLLIDPYLSDSLTQKYAATTKPHVRMTAIPIAPARLDFIDVVTSSHNHTDHLDAETLLPLLQVNPGLTIIAAAANQTFVADRLNLVPARITPLGQAAPLTVGGFTFHAIPAAHQTLEQDDAGHYRCIGLVIQAGPWTIYHSGDTMPYAGLAEALLPWPIDLAILPINGYDPARGVAGNLSGSEAAQLAKQIGAGLVIPCHYEMFTFNTVAPDEFQRTAERLRQPFRLLRCAERLTLL
jgi:L-ascorbate metabolism protein UlaG (beta-lactamase superfamily)